MENSMPIFLENDPIIILNNVFGYLLWGERNTVKWGFFFSLLAVRYLGFHPDGRNTTIHLTSPLHHPPQLSAAFSVGKLTGFQNNQFVKQVVQGKVAQVCNGGVLDGGFLGLASFFLDFFNQTCL